MRVTCSVLLKDFTAFGIVQQNFNGTMSKTFPLILKKKKKSKKHLYASQVKKVDREKGPSS